MPAGCNCAPADPLQLVSLHCYQWPRHWITPLRLQVRDLIVGKNHKGDVPLLTKIAAALVTSTAAITVASPTDLVKVGIWVGGWGFAWPADRQNVTQCLLLSGMQEHGAWGRVTSPCCRGA